MTESTTPNMPATEQAFQCLAEASNAPGEPCTLKAHHHGRHQDANGGTWMHEFKYGAPDIYEVTWMSGHIERVPAHQVTYPEAGLALARSVFNIGTEGGTPRVRIHAEINGNWRLVLAAREADIRSLRLVTDGEPLPGGAA
jgi:hypothetical protein